jgi:hypothetical protein
MKNSEISYCVSTQATCDLTKKITEWIAARRAEGWAVDLIIKEDQGRPVAMWQCVSHPIQYREFTDCIGMDGREFQMN